MTENPLLSRRYPSMLPPTWFIVCAVIELIAQRVSPPAWTIVPSDIRVGGVGFVMLGLVAVGSASRRFQRAQTPIVPGAPPTALVMGGIYRRSRNPMYLGMLLVLIGEAIMLGSPLPWIAVVAFVVIIRLEFIRHEERLLAHMFNGIYRDYCGRVRRWI